MGFPITFVGCSLNIDNQDHFKNDGIFSMFTATIEANDIKNKTNTNAYRYEDVFFRYISFRNPKYEYPWFFIIFKDDLNDKIIKTNNVEYKQI